ncbi:MAG: hypothetical protein E7202_06660 [Selenomonas ruminantium]|jgi:hypothetical protein|nr:hypothetical protein [Selenomonas ruminantium]MDD6134076.1 hypothetical protein [Selenomonadaceae bacterium]
MADKKKAAEATYTKEALANSKKYRAWRDVLMIALEYDKQYTMAEADATIDKFKTTKVVEKVNGKE